MAFLGTRRTAPRLSYRFADCSCYMMMLCLCIYLAVLGMVYGA